MTAPASPGASRSPGPVTLVVLAVVGVLGLAIVAFGLSGLAGATPTPRPSAAATSPEVGLASPSASPEVSLASPSASPSSPPGLGGAASPSSSPGVASDDPLLLGLLAQDDLPGLVSPTGPEEGTAYDIDDQAFGANDGIRVVSQTWQSLADTGLAAVFDFRMQFPTDAAAAAYLAAAEPVLSEAEATGQAPIASPPVIGDERRVYGLETEGTEGTVLLRTYLFRVGPVVAKVVAGGPGVDAATTDALAGRAAERVRAAGPPAVGSPRPSVPPSPSPAPTAPLPTGEALAARLLEHVPPEIGASCVPDSQRLWAGELATLVCTDAAGAVTVTYSGFESADAAEAAIDASLETIDLSDPAPSCDQGPYVGTYQVEDEEVGRVVCWPEQGGQAIMWSDDRLAILAVGVSPSLDAAGLYLWWLGAGPVLDIDEGT